MSPQYDECPTYCGEADAPGNSFCGHCPVKESEDDFEFALAEELDKRCGRRWRKWGIKNLKETVLEIATIEQSSVTMPKTQFLIKTFNSAKKTVERENEWYERERRKNTNP